MLLARACFYASVCVRARACVCMQSCCVCARAQAARVLVVYVRVVSCDFFFDYLFLFFLLGSYFVISFVCDFVGE